MSEFFDILQKATDWYLNASGGIRHRSPGNNPSYTPIEVVILAKTHILEKRSDLLAAKQLGLRRRDYKQIKNASDSYDTEHPRLRRKILAATGLLDSTH